MSGCQTFASSPARELDVALVERRLDLEQQHGLFDVEHLRHDPHYGTEVRALSSGVAGPATPTTSPGRHPYRN